MSAVLLHRACAAFHVVAWSAFQAASALGARGALPWAFLCAVLAAAHLVRGELIRRALP